MAGNALLSSILRPLDWFYPTAKSRYLWRMNRALDAAEAAPILVLQMGKVGSKSVQAGLDALELSRPIYHAHFLSRERTRETEIKRRKHFRTDRHTYLMRPWLNQFLLNRFERRGSDERWKIVTLTREPVGRNISAFFQNLRVDRGDADGKYSISSDYYDIQPTRVSVAHPQQLAKLFFSHAPHDSAMKFFDREIRDIFGVDVIGEGFPIDKGFGIYEGEGVDVLVLKLERLEEVASEAINRFLDIENFELINRNVASDKVYAPLYDAFREQAVISNEYIDEQYSSRYMTTFYSDAEIAEFRNRWLTG